jgi:GIY-YIG catalytic domain
MSILLSALIPLANLSDYKLHFATWNQHEKPLDVFSRSKDEWQGWNQYRNTGSKDVFNRPHIFSLIQYYPKPNRWLFGGIFDVLARPSNSHYRLQLSTQAHDFIGRLLIEHRGPGVQGRSFKPETYFHELLVAELLEEPYQGEKFPGFDAICCSFGQLEPIFRRTKPDWKAALESVKGVYLITDTKNGKKYVGSAYGAGGIWQRWSCYIGTGHGWNDELTRMIKTWGIGYARENFQLSLLEHYPARTNDDLVIQREQFWKQVLKTRDFGYNRN